MPQWISLGGIAPTWNSFVLKIKLQSPEGLQLYFQQHASRPKLCECRNAGEHGRMKRVTAG